MTPVREEPPTVLHASAIPASPETAPDLPDLDYPIFRDDTDRAVDLDPLGLDGFYSQAPVRRRHVRDVMTTLRLVTRRGHRRLLGHTQDGQTRLRAVTA